MSTGVGGEFRTSRMGLGGFWYLSASAPDKSNADRPSRMEAWVTGFIGITENLRGMAGPKSNDGVAQVSQCKARGRRRETHDFGVCEVFNRGVVSCAVSVSCEKTSKSGDASGEWFLQYASPEPGRREAHCNGGFGDACCARV